MNGAPVANTTCMWGAGGGYKCGGVDYASLAPGMTILSQRSPVSVLSGPAVRSSTTVLESMANQRAFADAAPVSPGAKSRY